MKETGIILLVVAMVALLVWAMVVDEKRFNQFRIDHHCAITGIEEGYDIYSSANDGGVQHVPARTHFHCDNGDLVRQGDYR